MRTSSILLSLVFAVSGCSSADPSSPQSAAPNATDGSSAPSPGVASFDYVWTTVKEKHWDPKMAGVDWEAARTELRPRVIADPSVGNTRKVIAELLKRLGASHYAVLPGELYKAVHPKASGTKTAGPAAPQAKRVGVGLEFRWLNEQAVVTKVADGSSAARAGVRPGWVFAGFGSEKDFVKELKTLVGDAVGNLEQHLIRALNEHFRGEEGTKIRPTFVNEADKKVEVELVCARPAAARKTISFGNLPPLSVDYQSRALAGGKVGYVSLSVFFDPVRVMTEYKASLQRFAKTRGLIIDLRGNPGGIMGIGNGMANWLVSKSGLSLGVMKSRDSEMKLPLSPQLNPYMGKVAILIDSGSGSTSEVVAAGLQDIGRARIFGTRSAGQTLPSLVERLPNGDRFQFAFSDYVSSGGRRLEGKGVEPDEVVPLTRAGLLKGDDPVIERAQAWILKN